MIIGHLAIAGIAKTTWFERENLLFLSLAALGPDVIDKPAHFLFGFPGRGVSHSLLFFIAVIIIAWSMRGWLGYSLRTVAAGLTMWATHLVTDFPEFHVLFWPLGGTSGIRPKVGLIEKMWQFYIDRYYFAQFWMEVICIGALIAILLSKSIWPLIYKRKPVEMSSEPVTCGPGNVGAGCAPPEIGVGERI